MQPWQPSPEYRPFEIFRPLVSKVMTPSLLQSCCLKKLILLVSFTIIPLRHPSETPFFSQEHNSSPAALPLSWVLQNHLIWIHSCTLCDQTLTLWVSPNEWSCLKHTGLKSRRKLTCFLNTLRFHSSPKYHTSCALDLSGIKCWWHLNRIGYL